MMIMFCLFRWETEKEKSPIYILNIRSYKGIRHDTDKNTWKHIRVWWIIRGYDIIVIWKAWMASGLWQCKYQPFEELTQSIIKCSDSVRSVMRDMRDFENNLCYPQYLLYMLLPPHIRLPFLMPLLWALVEDSPAHI